MDRKDEKLLWVEKSREKVCDCAIFDYYKVKRQGPIGEIADFTVLKAPDWVTVIAPVQKNESSFFLMVRQFRHGSGRITVEFPAGVIELGETPIEAAARELLEETGYQAGELIKLGSVNPNPAFLNNISYTYLARDLKKVADLSLDEYEWVELLEVPFFEVQQKMGVGEFDNGIMVSALAYYLKTLGKKTKKEFSTD